MQTNGELGHRLEFAGSVPQPRIQSTISGRREIDHIKKQIDRMSVMPDFGFDVDLRRYQRPDEDDNFTAWGIIWDFITSNEKYERLENYLGMRHD